MRALVRHLEAEAAHAPVDVQVARAEHAVALRIVKVCLVDVVVQPAHEVGRVAHGALAVHEASVLVRERQVLRDEVVHRRLRLAVLGEGRERVVGKAGHGLARLGGKPRLVRRELGLDRLPAVARDLRGRRDHSLGERAELGAPERMHAGRERQDGIRGVGHERQVLGRREELVDLRLHGLERGVGVGRLVAHHGGGLRVRLPGEARGNVREEGVGLRLVDAVLAVAVEDRTLGGGDRGDRVGHGGVGGGLRRHHAVAVERLRVEGRYRLRHVSQQKRRRVRLAGAFEQLLEGGQERLPLGRVAPHLVQRDLVLAREEEVELREARRHPFDGRQHLGHAHASVAVGVEQLQRGGVKPHARRRRGKHRPQLLVQLLEREQVVARLHLRLHAPCGLEELPFVHRFSPCL